MSDLVKQDSWEYLKQFTDARIALGRVGNSIPTKNNLAFNLAHAQARDAVYSALDYDHLKQKIEQNGKYKSLIINSKASNREIYLQRPDLGGQLTEDSEKILSNSQKQNEISIVVADGLSAKAVNEQAAPLVNLVGQSLFEVGFTLAPVSLVKQGRVAIGDPVAVQLGSKLVIVLIGERPGLSSPESMGAYITYQPKIGTTNDLRNCISNIRMGGLSIENAAAQILELVKKAFHLKITGVGLKLDSSLYYKNLDE